MAEPLTVWRFTDGKAGHESQSAGLVSALGGRVDVREYTIPSNTCRHRLLSWLFKRPCCGNGLPDPDLLIGAGHDTHLPMLAIRRARGGRVVVLMKPSLPVRLFDLCIIPEHDRPQAAENILVTRGVLNRLKHSAEKDAGNGLFLIGGPSAHVEWSSADIVGQIRLVLERSPGVCWTLTTSRRTPADIIDSLGGISDERLTVVPCEETGPDWLPDRLEAASPVWISEDSVSMIYEALTAGAAVGLLSVKWRNTSDRLALGIQSLLRDGLVTSFDSWRQGTELARPSEVFDEAGRCADWMLEKWLKES